MTKATVKPNFEAYEKLFLALGDRTRLKLLSLMAEGPVSVGSLVDQLNESQPKVSRHLAYLRNCGVVRTKRDGKWIYYDIQQSDNLELDRVLKFVIQTLLGTIPPEEAYPKKSHQIKPQAEEIAGEAEIEQTDASITYEEAEQTDLDAAEQESFVGSEDGEKELDVFLL